MLYLAPALAMNAYVMPGPAIMPVRTTFNPNMNVDAAKAAWLARLDVPSFQSSPQNLGLVGDRFAAVAEAPAAPIDAQSEDTAKAQWLAKLDTEPAWKAAPVNFALAAPKGENNAKVAWLARLDNEPNWKSGSVVPTAEPVAAPVVAAAPVDPVYLEDSAKAAWLARLETEPQWKIPVQAMMQPTTHEEAVAKAAWLAKLDQTPDLWKAAPDVYVDSVAAPAEVPIAAPAPQPYIPASSFSGNFVLSQTMGRAAAAAADWYA